MTKEVADLVFKTLGSHYNYSEKICKYSIFFTYKYMCNFIISLPSRHDTLCRHKYDETSNNDNFPINHGTFYQRIENSNNITDLI